MDAWDGIYNVFCCNSVSMCWYETIFEQETNLNNQYWAKYMANIPTARVCN